MNSVYEQETIIIEIFWMQFKIYVDVFPNTFEFWETCYIYVVGFN